MVISCSISSPRRERSLRPGPAHRQRAGDTPEAGGVDRAEPGGESGGECADEGVAGAGGVGHDSGGGRTDEGGRPRLADEHASGAEGDDQTVRDASVRRQRPHRVAGASRTAPRTRTRWGSANRVTASSAGSIAAAGAGLRIVAAPRSAGDAERLAGRRLRRLQLGEDDRHLGSPGELVGHDAGVEGVVGPGGDEDAVGATAVDPDRRHAGAAIGAPGARPWRRRRGHRGCRPSPARGRRHRRSRSTRRWRRGVRPSPPGWHPCRRTPARSARRAASRPPRGRARSR